MTGNLKISFLPSRKNWERRISIDFLRIASLGRRLLDVENECFVIFLFSCLLSSNWSLLRGQQSRCIEKRKAPSQKKKKINWIALNVFQKSFKDFRIPFFPPCPLSRRIWKFMRWKSMFQLNFTVKSCYIEKKMR